MNPPTSESPSTPSTTTKMNPPTSESPSTPSTTTKMDPVAHKSQTPQNPPVTKGKKKSPKKKKAVGDLAQSIHAPDTGNNSNNVASVHVSATEHQKEEEDNENKMAMNWMINNAHRYLPMAARLEAKTDQISNTIEAIEKDSRIAAGIAARLECGIRKQSQLAEDEAKLARKQAELAKKEVELAEKEVELAKKGADLTERELSHLKDKTEAEVSAHTKVELLMKNAQSANRSRSSNLGGREVLVESQLSKLSTIFAEANTMSTKVDAIYAAKQGGEGTEHALNELKDSIEQLKKSGENWYTETVNLKETLNQMIKECVVKGGVSAQGGAVQLDARLDMIIQLWEGQVTMRESIEELKVSVAEQRSEAAKLQSLYGQPNLRDASREAKALENNTLNLMLIACITHAHLILTYLLSEFGFARNSCIVLALVGLVVLVFCYINKTTASRWRSVTLGLFLLIILSVPLFYTGSSAIGHTGCPSVLHRGLHDINTDTVTNDEWVDVIPDAEAKDPLIHVNGCNGTIDEVEHIIQSESQTLAQISISSEDLTETDLYPTSAEPLKFSVKIAVALAMIGSVSYIVLVYSSRL